MRDPNAPIPVCILVSLVTVVLWIIAIRLSDAGLLLVSLGVCCVVWIWTARLPDEWK